MLSSGRSLAMHSTPRTKFGRKAAVWHLHGKHAKIDPRLLNPPKVRHALTTWYPSVREAFAASRTERS